MTLTGDPNFESKAYYSFTVVATDAAGNASDQVVDLLINNLDELAPTITSGASASVNENVAAGTLVYTATSTDSGDINTGSTTYSLSGTDASAFSIDASTGAVTINASPNYEAKSSYSFSVVATDAASNASDQLVDLVINNLDEVAPTIAISSDVSTLKAGDTATLTFTLSEASTDFISADVSATGGTISNFAGSGTAYTATFTPTANSTAKGVISVASSTFADAAGNTNNDGADTNNSVTLTVDTATPSAPSITSITDDVGTITGTIASGGSTDDTVLLLAGTAEANSTVSLYSGSTSLGSTSANGSGVWTFTTATLANGSTYTFNATATDAAGNMSAASANYTVTVDTAITAGSLSLANYTDSGTSSSDFISTDKSFDLSLTGQESGATVLYQLSTDGGSNWSTTTSTQSNLTDGAYQFRAVVSDAAGNTANTNSISLTVDTAAPNAPAFSLATDSGSNNSDGVTNDGTVTVSGIETNATWEYSTNSGTSWSAGSGNFFTLAAGSYAIGALRVRQTDRAGNTTTTPSQNTAAISVDASAPNAPLITSVSDDVSPITGILTSGGRTNDTNLTVRVSLSGTNAVLGDTVQLYNSTIALGSAYILLAGDINNGYADVTTDALANGITYAINAKVTDIAGNTSTASGNFITTVDATAPLFISGPSVTGAGNITLTANEDGTAALYKADNTPLFPAGVTANTTATLTLVAQAALTTATLKIADAAGNLTAAAPTFLLGTSSADLINGTAAADLLYGFSGNDTLNGGLGADTMIGGLGNDSYTVDNINDLVTEGANEGNDWVYASIDYILGSEVENLDLAGTANLNGTGNALNNSITGNASANILNGGAGNDTLNGGLGADTMIGGLGNDSYTVDNINDLVTEGANEGNDWVYASIDYILGSEVENLALTGTADLIGTGNALNNSITGNAGANILDGGDGNDIINGGLGVDTMIGGFGNDIYTVDNINDLVIEATNRGIDWIYASINYTISSDVENLVLTGTAHLNGTGNALNNSITGNAGANILNGGDGNDTINGGLGADTMIGGLGNDTYIVDNINLVVSEGTNEGIDWVYASIDYTLSSEVENLALTGIAHLNGTGNALNNSITGNAGTNILNGGAGNDTISGGAGNDTLIGGIGRDIITGGADNDVFRFAAGDALISGTTSLSFDRITDFAIGIDSLDGVNAVSAFNLTKLGSVGTSLTSTKIASLLTTTAFTANGAAAFSFGSGAGLRTFVALNDAVAGYQAGTDNIIEITYYTGNLANLSIV